MSKGVYGNALSNMPSSETVHYNYKQLVESLVITLDRLDGLVARLVSTWPDLYSIQPQTHPGTPWRGGHISYTDSCTAPTLLRK